MSPTSMLVDRPIGVEETASQANLLRLSNLVRASLGIDLRPFKSAIVMPRSTVSPST